MESSPLRAYNSWAPSLSDKQRAVTLPMRRVTMAVLGIQLLIVTQLADC